MRLRDTRIRCHSRKSKSCPKSYDDDDNDDDDDDDDDNNNNNNNNGHADFHQNYRILYVHQLTCLPNRKIEESRKKETWI